MFRLSLPSEHTDLFSIYIAKPTDQKTLLELLRIKSPAKNWQKKQPLLVYEMDFSGIRKKVVMALN